MIDKEVRMILHRVIDRCNWCRNQNIRCEECNKLYGPCRRNMAILDLGKYFEPDWIPCSEMLPDCYEPVLAIAWDEAENGWYYYVATYHDEDGFITDSTYVELNFEEPFAWMPLPPAYKEGEDE